MTRPADSETVRALHSVPPPLVDPPSTDPAEWDADELHARLDRAGHDIRALAERIAAIAVKPRPREDIDETLLVILAADMQLSLQVERQLRNLRRLAEAG